MIELTRYAKCLSKGLQAAALTLPLIFIPFGGGACAATCDSGGSGTPDCSLEVPIPLLPDPHMPSCCPGELMQGETYLSPRKGKKEREAPSPHETAAATSRQVLVSLTDSPRASLFRLSAALQGATPLYLHHAALLI